MTPQSAMDAGVNGAIISAIHSGKIAKEDIAVYMQLMGWELGRAIEIQDQIVKTNDEPVSQPVVYEEVPQENPLPREVTFDNLSTIFNRECSGFYSDQDIKNLYSGYSDARKLGVGDQKDWLCKIYRQIINRCDCELRLSKLIKLPDGNDYDCCELVRYFIIEEYHVRFHPGDDSDE
jgi:hypothetical protein